MSEFDEHLAHGGCLFDIDKECAQFCFHHHKIMTSTTHAVLCTVLLFGGNMVLADKKKCPPALLHACRVFMVDFACSFASALRMVSIVPSTA